MIDTKIPSSADKAEVFTLIENFLHQNGFKIVNKDLGRPWGGFFVINEQQSAKFTKFFFADVPEEKGKSAGKISPKILIVEQGKRLSWQYHHRRAELWKIIGGTVGVATSSNDEEGTVGRKNVGEIVELRQGERHRLVGLNEWGVVAEIWKHSDSENPSDEEDIVRLQDDFGR